MSETRDTQPDAITPERLEAAGFAELLAKGIEEIHARTAHLPKPIAAVSVSKQGESIEVLIDTSKATFSEWIPGEGADIGLLRDIDAPQRVRGAKLPCDAKTLVVCGDFQTVTIDLGSGNVTVDGTPAAPAAERPCAVCNRKAADMLGDDHCVGCEADQAKAELERWAEVSSKRNHGASGLCCRLREYEVQQRQALESDLTALRSQNAALAQQLAAARGEREAAEGALRFIASEQAGATRWLVSMRDLPDAEIAKKVRDAIRETPHELYQAALTTEPQ